jgi:F-type H+-transporting ATPase subunit b
MELVTPGLGLIIWTTLVFLILLVLLRKFAWKPIMVAVKTRETDIENALNSAKEAKEEIAALTATNEELLKEARAERDEILRIARDTKDQIVSEAKSKAKEEGSRLILAAKETIQNEKLAAITELKNQVATLSIEIAEKVIRHELSSSEQQKALAESLVKEVSLN